jgi:hypothetical protein
MRDTEAEEPFEQLQREVREAGFSVTKDQRHRWEQAGLLPQPRQRGLGQGRGTEVLYPPGSAGQLVALCKHRGKKRRSLKALAWDLWWDGYPLSGAAEDWVRGFFRTEAAFLDKLAAAGFKERDDFLDALEESSRVRLSHPLVSRTRRRTGRVSFSTLLRLLVEATTGTPPELDDEDDAKIVAKGLGFRDPQHAEPALRSVASVLDPRKLLAVFDRASMDDLRQGRDEIGEVLQWIDAVKVLMATGMGRPTDLQLLAAASRPSHREGPAFVLAWLSMMSRPGARQTYDAVRSMLRDVAKGTLDPTDAMTTDSTLGPTDQSSQEPSHE